MRTGRRTDAARSSWSRRCWTRTSGARARGAHARLVGRRSGRRADERPRDRVRTTIDLSETGTAVSIRERFQSRRGGANGVDTNDVGAFRTVVPEPGSCACSSREALALVLAAAASARDPQTTERALIPQDTVGVVVLDLSLSITDDDYAGIRRTLRRLVAEEAPIGLVVFSDVPYELLPPGRRPRAPTVPPLYSCHRGSARCRTHGRSRSGRVRGSRSRWISRSRHSSATRSRQGRFSS